MKSSSRAISICWRWTGPTRRRLPPTQLVLAQQQRSNSFSTTTTPSIANSRVVQRPLSTAVHTLEDEYGYHSSSFRPAHSDDGNSSGETIPKQKEQQQQQPNASPSPDDCPVTNHNVHENHLPMPPPLPGPSYSVHKRVLPPGLTALSSPKGRQYLLETMANQTSESYWALTEQFVNQSDPAFCGVTTLMMVLNAMNMDPNVRWKGGWRYYGDEDVLLQRCCLNPERIRRVGITMEQFMVLGTCHGCNITLKRPNLPDATEIHHQSPFELEDFRRDIRETLDSRLNQSGTILVVSYARHALQQTGDGHFSPIAAYHEASDQVLILDVARFKYAPYWVSVEDLYRAMQPLDGATQRPRGWYVMTPPTANIAKQQSNSEQRRPAHLVPEAQDKEICPVGSVKVQFCRGPTAGTNSKNNNTNINENKGGKS